MEKIASVLLNQYEVGRILGQGTFSKVHHARNIKTGRSVAIKILDKSVLKDGMIDQIKREVSVMGSVRHPNLVQLYEVIATKTKLYFVMEYVKGGKLFDEVAKGRLKEGAARKYFQQLISAVDYFHCRGVYHLNLNPDNLLLDEYGNLKVSDFGLSALAASKHRDCLLHTTCETLAYVAPEEIHRNQYRYDEQKSDVWSCGVILFVLLAGYLPFQGSNLKMYRKVDKADFEYQRWFKSGVHRFLFERWSTSGVRRLLSKLLDPSPCRRITATGIIKNPWFQNGFDSRISDHPYNGLEPSNAPAAVSDNVFKPCEVFCVAVVYRQETIDIISLPEDFDLSSLFEEKSQKEKARFSARQIASAILLKLKKVAKKLKLNVEDDGGLVKFEDSKITLKGSFDAEIFEVPELKKPGGGDKMGYQNALQRKLDQL